MADSENNGGVIPPNIGATITPPTRITVPDFIYMHMISDDELTAFSRTEAGLLGTVGWAAAGASIGFLAGAARTIKRSFAGEAISGENLVNAMLFVACVVAATICLILHFKMSQSSKSQADKIRARRQHTPI